MDQLGTNGDGRYCVVEEELILQAIVLYCWPYEARYGDAHRVARQAQESLTRWLANGLPHRLVGGKRCFDFCQVINFMKWTADTHGDPVYEGAVLHVWRRSLATLMQDDWLATREAKPLAARRFIVTFRREFNLCDLQPGTLVRLRVPLPFPDATQDQIVLEQVDTSAQDARVTPWPGRLDVRCAVPQQPGQEFVQVRVAFTASAPSYEVDPNSLVDWDRQSPDYKLYTRSTEGLIQVTDSITQLAAELAGNATHPWQALGGFWAFFFGRMRAGHIHHDELDPADPLGVLVQRGWFDCYTGSALLVALCRSHGIPARLMNGILLYPFAFHHYWCEVHIPSVGWIPLDLGSWSLAAGRLDNLPWSRLFFGRLDYRMKTECFPRLVVGNPGVRFPPAWYMVERLAEQGAETAFHSLATGQLLYRDHIRVDGFSEPRVSEPRP